MKQNHFSKTEPPKLKENLINQNGNYLEKNILILSLKKDGERIKNAVTLPTKTRVKKMFNKHKWYTSVI